MPSLDLRIDTIVPLDKAASVPLTDRVGCMCRWLFLDCAMLRFIWPLVGPLAREKSSKPWRLAFVTLSTWLEGINVGRVPPHQTVCLRFSLSPLSPHLPSFGNFLSTFFSRHMVYAWFLANVDLLRTAPAIDLDCPDIEWLALETNRDHSVIF